jgi:hypothetical protein
MKTPFSTRWEQRPVNRNDEVTIQVSDLEDVRNVLSACLNFFQAHDLMEAQKHYEAVAYSPLTNEIGRVTQRFDGYMGDFLLNKHESESDENEPSPAASTSQELVGSEEGAQELTAAPEEEVLPDLPLGKPASHQKGKRVSARRRLVEEQGEEVEHQGV